MAVATVVLASAFQTSVSDANAAKLRGHFLGSANVVKANAKVGPVRASINRAAFRACGCNGTKGKTRKSVVEELKAGDNGDVATVGVMKAVVYTDRTAKKAIVKNRAKVGAINLLDGLITADGVVAHARFTAKKNNMYYSLRRSKLVNLVIAGTPIDPDVEENTEIALPGIGRVILKAVKETGNYSRKGAVRIEMLRIEVGQVNSLNLPVGAVIVVARATAGYSRTPVEHIVGGTAYAASVNAAVGDTLENKIGKPALLRIGCEGTKGKLKKVTLASLGVDNVLEIDGGNSTGISEETSTGVRIKMRSKLAGISLLGGIVEVGGLKAVSKDRLRNGNRKSMTGGTKVVGLKVAGIPLGDFSKKNVKVTVPLVGTLYLNEVVPPSRPRGPQRVNALRLEVTLGGNLLPVGGEITLAHASSKVY